MNDAGCMHLGERLARLQGDLASVGYRKLAFFGDELSEVVSLEVLHDDVRATSLDRTDVVDPSHVLAPHLGRDLCLALETLDRLLVAHRLSSEKLDGYPLIEP